jgi:hypothetical protein
LINHGSSARAVGVSPDSKSHKETAAKAASLGRIAPKHAGVGRRASLRDAFRIGHFADDQTPAHVSANPTAYGISARLRFANTQVPHRVFTLQSQSLSWILAGDYFHAHLLATGRRCVYFLFNCFGRRC